MEYAELYCRSGFSFLCGASQPHELVETATSLGYSALALTDECSLAGVVRAHESAREAGLKLIIGSLFRLEDGLRLIMLARNRKGYGNLSELITLGRRRAGKGSYELQRRDIIGYADGCIGLLLPGGIEDHAQARWLAEIFPGNAWIAVGLFLQGDDARHMDRMRTLSRRSGLPLVAAGDVRMHCRARRPLHDVMTAIRLHVPVARAGHALLSNSERHLRPCESLQKIYPEGLLAETLVIASRCRFSLDELRYEYPRELVPKALSPSEHLRALVEAGAQERWPTGVAVRIRTLIERELSLISELSYEPYFLTVHDIVRFARSRGILCQGRGSAANSVVCYCLGITEVDPARIDTLFERFISKERNEPPDIDVDFEHERREEVIQYIYEKYGRDRAALTATVTSYRLKSAVRDVGKALGLDIEQITRLSKTLRWWDGKQVAPERLHEAGFDPDNPVIQQLIRLSHELVGFPRHLSQHVGGFVISQGPLSRLVPIENAAMPDRTVIQWDKDDLDTLGLLKVDCLALGMLTAIRKALQMLSDYHGRKFSMSSIPPEDPQVYRMLQQGDSVSVFQVESRAQMSMLPRLKPACFYDLVVEVAIVRPGPIQGDMVHPYLRRRQGLEAVEYPSDEVRRVLERTLGIPIFQEQVIKVAMVAAGFSAGEADHLRRSMAAWRRRGGLGQFEQRLTDGMRERGYSEDFARRIYHQILGFGEYGFPESHAASFALLVYVSAWLKCHHPAAFVAALLNSQPMGFYAPAQLLRDAREHRVAVYPVDVCRSEWDCALESVDDHTGRPALRLGLRRIKGFSEAGAGRLLAARAQKMFSGVHDLARRADLGRRDMDALTAADALAGLSGNRHQTRWACAGIEPSLPLLPDETSEPVPMLPAPTEGQNIISDYASLGHSLRRHPLALLRTRLLRKGILSAAEVAAKVHGAMIYTAGIVIGRQRPGTASGVTFVTIEDESGQLNLIVWGNLAESQRRELLTSRLLAVRGEVQREGPVLHVIAKHLEDHSGLLGALPVRSRDFH